MRAGHVIIVVVAALALGTLFNAADIRATAERQPLGWQRDTALALVEPVYWLSELLRLDRPREFLDVAMGRAGPQSAGAVASATAMPTEAVAERGVAPTPEPTVAPAPSEEARATPTATPTPTPMPTPTDPPLRTVSEEEPLRMFVGGDSMVGQFGPMLQNRANKTGVVETEVQYEFSSGLTRPDAFYDWPARFSEVLAESDPDVIVVFFGGNENRGMLLDGSVVEPGTPEWEKEYRARVERLMDQLAAPDRRVYWMGMPITSSESLSERMELFNEIYASSAETRPGVEFVESWPVFVGDDGGYSEYLPDETGTLVDMRLDDGIHLTTAGGIRLAEVVFEIIAEDWSLSAAGGDSGGDNPSAGT